MEWKLKKYLEMIKYAMEYKLTDSPYLIKESFSFLEQDFGFKIIEDEVSNSGVFLIYENDFGKIGISHDYRDSIFNVDIIQGKETHYPNDAEYWNKVKPLESLIKKYEPNFEAQMIQPKGRQYLEAIKLSANLLKKYGGKVLKGQEWF